MALPKFESPFAPLALSYDDKKELCRLAKRVVDDTLQSFESFLWTDQSQVSQSRFTLLKHSDDVHVYQERRPPQAHVESLLTVGSVAGTLDDAMLGVLTKTTDAMRLKAAYMNELPSLGDCALLATVQEPKQDKPFRSLTLKWRVQTLPLTARALLRKPQDLVFIEATGTTRLSNGERVGFHVVQSIDHMPQLRALPTYTRASVSMGAVWRQQASDRVQVYAKSYLDLPDRLLASVLLRMTAEAQVAVWRHVHCAQMKKLTWLLRRQLSAETPSQNVDRCKVCTAKAKTLCVVCAKAVCAKCRVKRELWAIEHSGRSVNGELVASTVAFCVPCLTLAVRQSAADVARDELPDRGDVFKKDPPASTRSRRRLGSTGKAFSVHRSSLSSSTSSERTQDTTETLSHASSRPNLSLGM